VEAVMKDDEDMENSATEFLEEQHVADLAAAAPDFEGVLEGNGERLPILIPPQKAAASSAAAAPAGEMATGAKHQWKVFGRGTKNQSSATLRPFHLSPLAEW